MNQLLKFKQEAIYMDCCLNELGTFYGGLSGKTKEHFGTGDAKFVTYMNVFSNCIARKDQCECVLISDDEKQNLVKKGDILFTQSSETPEEVGMASIWTHDLDVYLNSFCFGFRVLDPKKTNPLYLTYLLRSPKYRQAISIEAQGISRYNLSSSRLSSLKLRLHSCEEQQKIAEFFTALDEKIELLVKKIKFTEKLRNGLMYSLLNQQINIGQTEKKYPQWETLQLKQCVSFFKGGSLAKKDLDDDGDKPCLLYGELYTTYGCTTSKIISRTNVSSPLVVSRKNDVVLPMSGETAEEIAKATCLLVDDVAYGGDLLILRSQMLYGPFLSYALNSVHRHSISRIAQGKSVVHINATNLSEISISVPCMEEQILIADCLMHIDNKIDILDKQKKTLDAQKKAFMQRMFV